MSPSKTPFKLGFQGWFLAQPHTGIGQHCLGLAKALHQEGVKLLIPVPHPLKIPGLPASALKVLRPPFWLLHPSLKKWFWERVQVPRFFAKQDLDWEYTPYPCPLPKTAAHPRAVTVHDLIPWTTQNPRPGRLKAAYLRATLRSLVHADHLFTVSKTTHRELGIPAATLLPNALSPVPKILPKTQIKNHLIYIGGYALHKKVPELVKAFQPLHQKDPSLRLVLVGQPHHASRFYTPIPETPGVIQTGPLSDAKLYSLLQSALAFVHFSEEEGFNIPLLQAMTLGTPAVVRDLPVNREISHGTALFFNPWKKIDFSAKLKTLKDPKKRAAVISAQKTAAKKYSWKKSAKIFLNSLRHVS